MLRRLRIFVLVAGSLALAVLLLLWAALSYGPQLARGAISRALSESLGQALTIARIDLSPLSGRLTVEDLQLASSDPQHPMLRLERVRLTLDLRAALQGSIVLQDLVIEQPELSLIRTGPNRIDAMDLIDRMTSGDGGETPVWRIQQVQLTQGRVRWNDRVVDRVTTLDRIDAQLREVSNDPQGVDAPLTAEVSLALNDRHPLSLKASATPFARAPTYRFEGTVDALPIEAFRPYLDLPEDLRRVDAEISARLSGRWDPTAAAPSALEIGGQLALSNLAVRDPQERQRLAIERLEVDLAPSVPLGGQVHLSEVLIVRPSLQTGRTPQGNPEWPRLTAAPVAPIAAAEPSGPHTATAGPKRLRIDRLSLEGGWLGWADAALPGQPSFRLDPITLTLHDMVWADVSDAASLKTKGRLTTTLDGMTALDVSWEGGLAAGQASLGLARLDLVRMAALAAPNPTAPVTGGRMHARGTVNWTGGPTPGWSVTDAEIELDGLTVGTAAQPLLGLDRATVSLRRLRVDPVVTSVTTDTAPRIQFDGEVGLPDSARLKGTGWIRPAPFALDAQLTLQRLPLAPLSVLLSRESNIALSRGQLWGQGRLRLNASNGAGVGRIAWQGEASVNDFALISLADGAELLRWSALALPGVRVDWSSAEGSTPQIEIDQIAFVDFDANIVLGRDGRLNLAQLTGAGHAAAEQPPQQATPAQTQSAPRPVAARPRIRVGGIQIAGGELHFTDRFIQPNYSTRLTQLAGSVGAFASDGAQPSDVLISGRVDDDTPLEISGLFDPLVPSRFIDIKATARGFELPRLSPYSGRWAGYTIEKGKLTADVRYRIEGDRLSAENRLVLNQLTLGDKVESPDALSVPLRLAVSLLKDSEGNIRLDLPIAGTLDDPQFSVAALLWTATRQLVVKALASPFRLLGSLVGHSQVSDISFLAFGEGSTALDADALQRLDALGAALMQRPGLSVEIAGVGDPGGEGQEALPRAQQRALAARNDLRDRLGIAAERLFLLNPRLAAPDDTRPPRRTDFTVR